MYIRMSVCTACMEACIYVCMCVCMYGCLYVCMYVRIMGVLSMVGLLRSADRLIVVQTQLAGRGDMWSVSLPFIF